MGSALETLCGQAYGAKQYHMIGIYTQRAILILLALSIALAVIWFYTGSILVTLGQDHDISAGAGDFNRWMIPGLFAYAILQCLIRFLQTQNNPQHMLDVYMISVGLGGAVSTRVSNELGAGNPQRARLAVCVAAVIATSEGAIIGTMTVLVRHVWGKLYSNEEEVIEYVARIMPLLALSDFLDGFQCVLSGAARGCGWQVLCSIINLGAYYVVGIPSAVLLAFVFHFGGMGLWTGIICGLSIQAVALVIVNVCTNWDHEVTKAVERVQATGQQLENVTTGSE